MVAVNLSLSGIEGLSAMRAFLDPKGYHEAMRYGLRYASRAATTEAAKQIRSRYTISSARVKQDITGPFLVNQDTEARLVFARKPPSAVQYAGRDNGRGLTFAPIRGNRVRVARGFIAQSGPLQGKPFRRRTTKRMPLDFVYGPSVGSVFAGQSQFGDQIRSAVSDRINEQFAKGVERKFGESVRRFGGR